MANEAVDKLCLAEKEGKALVESAIVNADEIQRKADADGEALIRSRLEAAKEQSDSIIAKAQKDAEGIYSNSKVESKSKCEDLKEKIKANKENVINGIISAIIS